jgi:hypothetical protein
MRFSIAAVVAALAAGVLGQQGYGLSSSTSSSTPIQYTTDVVSVYVTYCPEATTLTVGGSTYVVTTVRTFFFIFYFFCNAMQMTG